MEGRNQRKRKKRLIKEEDKDKEIILDFSHLVKQDREQQKAERAKEEYAEKARRSGYVERKRKELSSW